MNDTQLYLAIGVPIVSNLVALLLVSGALNTRMGDLNKRMDDVTRLIAAESARLEAVLKLELARVENRVKTLEERAGLIFRP